MTIAHVVGAFGLTPLFIGHIQGMFGYIGFVSATHLGM